MLKAGVKMLRPKQWIKNGFILLAPFFGSKLFEPEIIQVLIVAFASFSLAASGIYIVNDIRDRFADAQHPIKKLRPLPSGQITVSKAWILAVFVLLLALSIAFFLDERFFLVLIIYILLNGGYSFGLKNIALLDIFILSAGYVLRVYAGGFVSGIAPSEWLTIMTFLLAMFITLAKRRDDVLLFEESGTRARKVVDGYNRAFLNTAMSLMGGVLVVCYALYTLSEETQSRFNSDYLYLTVVFILAGVLRYLQIALVEQNSGSPTVLLYNDRFLQATVLLWLLSIGIIIY